jgi:hypothetical protein
LALACDCEPKLLMVRHVVLRDDLVGEHVGRHVRDLRGAAGALGGHRNATGAVRRVHLTGQHGLCHLGGAAELNDFDV